MNQKQAWFPEISKGLFRLGDNIYSTFRMIQQLAHAVDWFKRDLSELMPYAQFPIKTPNGNYCGKVIKEKVKVLDPYTVQVSRKPLYFWDGPRGLAFWSEEYGYEIETGDGGEVIYDISGHFDLSGEIPANNPWPLYVPPHIYDSPADVDDYGFMPTVDFDDDNNTPVYSHGINIYVNEALITNEIIETYDFWNGLIKFKWPVNVDDKIEVTYLYEQVKAVIPDINLNPVYPEMLYSGEYDFVECIK